MDGYLRRGALGLLLLLNISALCGAPLDDVLHHYETLHPAQVRHRVVRRDVTSGHPAVRQVQFDALGRHFHLYLQKRRSLLSPSFKVVAINSRSGQREVGLGDGHPYEGHLIGEEGTSEVHVVWEDEHNMAASITTKGAAIFVEPSWRHLPRSDNYSMIIYRKEDIKQDNDIGSTFCGTTAEEPKPERSYGDQQEQAGRSRRDTLEEVPEPLEQSAAPPWTSCEVLLVADYLFYKHMGHSSLSKTSAYLIGLLDRIDSMYRRTDFGHGFKGMGFQIKEIRIHEHYTAPTGTNPPHYNEKVNQTWETNLLLEVFTRSSSRAYCLAHLFTARGDWWGDVATLGLSYVASPSHRRSGGVCTKDNTGWSTTLNRHGRRLLTQEADFVTAHGHNWGSNHDPNTDECSPSAFAGGKYIMYTYSVTGYGTNNKLFSACSKRSIGAVLKNKANMCFSRRNKSFCGNSHVESDEECDVGPEGQKGLNPCCDEFCQLRHNATCSDMNDVCCSGCQYASPSTVCHELIDDAPTCDGIAYCTGTSAKCPPPKHKEDGSPCLHRGQCLRGTCIPFCQKMGMISCICDQVETACSWCCQADANSRCKPYIEDPSTNQTLPLPDGMPCIQGACDQGKCQKQVTDIVKRIWKIIENITPDQLVEFMRTNIVGTVIVLSLFVWIPVSCVISWKDRKLLQEQRDLNNWLRSDNTLLFKVNDPQRVRLARAFSRQYLQRSSGNLYPAGSKPLLPNY